MLFKNAHDMPAHQGIECRIDVTVPKWDVIMDKLYKFRYVIGPVDEMYCCQWRLAEPLRLASDCD